MQFCWRRHDLALLGVFGDPMRGDAAAAAIDPPAIFHCGTFSLFARRSAGRPFKESYLIWFSL